MKLLGVPLWIWNLVTGGIMAFIAVDFFSKADLVGTALAAVSAVSGFATAYLQKRWPTAPSA